MLAKQTAELLIQAARASRPASSPRELGSAEWMALRFLARANAHSRKPSALAAFEGSSRAAVSHVVGRLEREGYIARRPSPGDRRSYILEVTQKGFGALRNDPLEALVEAVRSLEEGARGALHEALRQVLRDLAESGAHHQFDVCRDCAHFVATVSNGPNAHWCARFQVGVESEAAELLCAQFRPRAA
jgi:DNA-binding MarR family transcriptional regulator